MLAVKLPEEIEQRLASLASKAGKSTSFYAREAILEHLEDIEDACIAEERLKNANEHRRWSQKDLENSLDMGS